MWTIFKLDKKRYSLLKSDFKKKLGNEFIFYSPKMKFQKFRKNKLSNFEFDLMGNYVFCFHKGFSKNSNLSILKFSRGLKYFLNGYNQSQFEISNFIKKCKSLEDKDGYISSNFFKICRNKTYKFSSGPFSEKLFKIIDLQKNQIEILMGNIKTTISKQKFLYKPVWKYYLWIMDYVKNMFFTKCGALLNYYV